METISKIVHDPYVVVSFRIRGLRMPWSFESDGLCGVRIGVFETLQVHIPRIRAREYTAPQLYSVIEAEHLRRESRQVVVEQASTDKAILSIESKVRKKRLLNVMGTMGLPQPCAS